MTNYITNQQDYFIVGQVDVIGEEMYYRNNSTGNPTKIHFIDPVTLKTYCGFKSFFAESVIGDESDHITEQQCCKRCLCKIDLPD